jgi:hypothetical protein
MYQPYPSPSQYHRHPSYTYHSASNNMYSHHPHHQQQAGTSLHINDLGADILIHILSYIPQYSRLSTNYQLVCKQWYDRRDDIYHSRLLHIDQQIEKNEFRWEKVVAWKNKNNNDTKQHSSNNDVACLSILSPPTSSIYDGSTTNNNSNNDSDDMTTNRVTSLSRPISIPVPRPSTGISHHIPQSTAFNMSPPASSSSCMPSPSSSPLLSIITTHTPSSSHDTTSNGSTPLSPLHSTYMNSSSHSSSNSSSHLSSPAFHISMIHRRDSSSNNSLNASLPLLSSFSMPRSPSSSSVTSINDNINDNERDRENSSSNNSSSTRNRYFPFTAVLRPSKLSSTVTNSKHINNSNNVSQLSSQLHSRNITPPSIQTTGKSITLSEAPTLHAHTCCQIGTLIYVFAGSKLQYNISGTNDLYTFNTLTHEWKKLVCTGDMPTARTFAPLISCRLPHNGYSNNNSSGYALLTMGGQDRDVNGDWSFFGDVYLFDIQTYEWKIVKYQPPSSLPSEPQHVADSDKQASYETPCARVGHRITVIPSLETAYMFGGCYCSTTAAANHHNHLLAGQAPAPPTYKYLADFWSLNLQTYEWTNLTSKIQGELPSARHSYEMSYLPYVYYDRETNQHYDRPQLLLFGGNSDVYTAKNLNDCYLIDVLSLTCKKLALNCLVPVIEAIQVNAEGNDTNNNTSNTQNHGDAIPHRARSDSNTEHSVIDDVESPQLRPATANPSTTVPPLTVTVTSPTTTAIPITSATTLMVPHTITVDAALPPSASTSTPSTMDVITSYEAKPHLPSSRWCPNMTVISSYIIMCGGYRSRQSPSDFSLRHLYTLNWKSLCQSVYENKAFPLPNKAIHYHSADASHRTVKYSGIWYRHTLNQSIQARTFSSSVTCSGTQMLVIGGAVKGIPTNEVLTLL